MESKMKILIATGIYPPKIGGPAQYAKNLKRSFESMGHEVWVKTFNLEDKLPSGLRHAFFFLKILPTLPAVSTIFILDTFSVGLPTVLACKILGKKSIIRVGGDFLWEQYIERTKKKVFLKKFYDTEKPNFNFKEKIIFLITKWTLGNASKIVFSTPWQRDFFIKAYDLKIGKTSIIENYYGEKETDYGFKSKIFLTSSRKLFLKNLAFLRQIFNEIKNEHKEIIFFDKNLPFDDFIKTMRECFCVVNLSFSEISPNMILDAIRLNRPFICTKEVGIYERIKEAGIFVDPTNEAEIKKAILHMLTDEGYRNAKEKVKSFNFVHNWDQIAEEFIEIYKKI